MLKLMAVLGLVMVGCGGDPIAEQTGAVSRDWTIELTGLCSGTMTTSATTTFDANKSPYATYYSGSWTCGKMSGPITGALDVRTSHFDLLMTPGPVSFHVVGLAATNGLAGTAQLSGADVAFTAQ